MEIDQLLRARIHKASRSGGPIMTFNKLFQEAYELTEFAKERGETRIQKMLERHLVITFVTGIEVFFRDYFDGIFRLCKPESFRPFLPDLHRVKYDIKDLLRFYEERVHPLELMASAINFQNMDAVGSTFSKLMGRSFWQEVLSLQFRIADTPGSETALEGSHLECLKRIIKLRHELIHDPDLHRQGITDDELADIHCASLLVLGCDVVLQRYIEENLDDEVRVSTEAKRRESKQ